MLMMFSAAIKNIPTDRVVPFNDDDLMLILSNKIALRMRNISSDKDEPFSIRYLMEKKEVFSCNDFKVRMDEFSEILGARIERFYETKKCDYIFFDAEEQKTLQMVLGSVPLSCTVDVYIRNDDGDYECQDLIELSPRLARETLNILSKLKVRAVMDCREYYNVTSGLAGKMGGRDSFEKRAEKLIIESMERYFIRYPRLSTLATKDDVNKYFKKMLSKYHPDKNKSEDAEDLFKIINEDSDKIKAGRWYAKLQ